MRKLIIVVASLLVVVLFILQGFQQTHPLPEPDNNRQSTATSEGIADALDAIYFDVSIMGVQDATAERLASDFGVDTSCLSAVYGRYTDGRVRHCRCHPGGAKAGAGSLRPRSAGHHTHQPGRSFCQL